MLIACRGAQGLGAAFLIPSALALIGAAFEESERGRAIGIWSGTTALAAGLGPLLGGWLVDHWSWRVIFLINPVLSLPAFGSSSGIFRKAAIPWRIGISIGRARCSPSAGSPASSMA